MEIELFLKSHNIPFKRNILLSSKTWIHTGGICSFWITPISLVQFKELSSFLYLNCIVFDLVGHTSNIFFHSTYNPEVVISTANVNRYNIIKDDVVTCDCGVNVIKLAKECMAQGYAGFYGLVGLPGTVASAAVNNASCFNCSISSLLLSADVLQSDGSVRTMTKEDFGYTKRSSVFKRNEVKGIILSIKLRLQRADDLNEEFRKAENTKIWRKVHQEGYAKSLGSIYSQKKLRRNLINILSTLCVRVVKQIDPSYATKVQKRLLLCLYGYKDLNRYISDKTINTFVWRDVYAEQAFERYKSFMSKVFKDLEIEIEEKS